MSINVSCADPAIINHCKRQYKIPGWAGKENTKEQNYDRMARNFIFQNNLIPEKM